MQNMRYKSAMRVKSIRKVWIRLPYSLHIHIIEPIGLLHAITNAIEFHIYIFVLKLGIRVQYMRCTFSMYTKPRVRWFIYKLTLATFWREVNPFSFSLPRVLRFSLLQYPPSHLNISLAYETLNQLYWVFYKKKFKIYGVLFIS